MKKDRLNWTRFILKINKGNQQVFSDLIDETVNYYNNRCHSFLNRMTPAEQHFVLQQTDNKKQIPADFQNIVVINNNEDKAVGIRKYQAELNQLFAENTLKAKQFNHTIDLPPTEVLISQDPAQLQQFLQTKFEQISQENQGLALQNLALFKAVEESKDQIQLLIKEKDQLSAQRHHDLAELAAQRDQEIKELLDFFNSMKEREHLVQLRREQRRQAKRKPLRSYLTFKEAQTCIDSIFLIHSDPYVTARTRIALILLYFTGLRLSNLLLFKIRHLHDLIAKGKTSIDIIKKGRQQLVIVGPSAQDVLKDNMQSIYIISDNKEDNDFVFTGKHTTSIAFECVIFNKNINSVLKLASTKLQKNILSHSFRVYLITNL
jgi:site-specific recombinase XerD